MPLVQAIRKNIFDMVSLIREAAYDVFDPTHSLKVTYLLFLVHKPVGDPSTEFFDNSRSQQHLMDLNKLFESLFSLFKIEFYPEKYLTIFEDIYDTDVISNIPLLQDIIFKEEQKRNVEENDNKQASHTLMQVNSVLV